MNAFVVICAILTFVALLYFFSTVRNLRRRRLLRAGGSATACAVTGVLGTAGLMLFTSYIGYDRLIAEQPIATVEFTEQAPQTYTARLMIDGRLDQLLPVYGDEWQIDARIVTWKPPATILGFEPVYRLERFSGRYASVDNELNSPRTVHDLAGERPLDLWTTARDYPYLLPGVDAFYGTATFLPMADGARYRVTLSRDALIARPANEAARKAVGDWGSGEP